MVPNGNGKLEEPKFQIVDPNFYSKLLDILKKRLPVCVQLYNAVAMQHMSRNMEDGAFEFYTYLGLMDDTAFVVGQESIKVKKEDEGILVVFPSVPYPELITPEIANEFVKSFSRNGSSFTNLSYALHRSSSPLIIQALLNNQFCVTAMTSKLYFLPAAVGTQNLGTNFENSNPTYIVQPLDPKDGKIVAEYHKFETWHKEEYYARRCIENNPSAGVYSKENGELMSWAIVYNFGSIGMLYTPEKFRGLGYGKLVMKNLIDQMWAKGLIPATTAEPRNHISDGIMKKLGFIETEEQDYCFTH